VSPALGQLLAALKLRTGGRGLVFGAPPKPTTDDAKERKPAAPATGHTMATVSAARQRLVATYGAPAFQWSVRNSRPG
jgi:hypothetical protein